jgi:hypothetical protein
MITSTYGVKLPEDGDQGPVVFPALLTNAEILRDHAHTGSDSAAVASVNLTKGSVNLASGDWVATGTTNGWKQTVTCPTTHTMANSVIRFRISAGGDANVIIYPTIVPLTATTFDVIVNDNSLNLEVKFI